MKDTIVIALKVFGIAVVVLELIVFLGVSLCVMFGGCHVVIK